ncbi:MAG: flagellar biosynthesis/type III secretory pathway chaperone [Halieaceae bacterium]|jgi:flagellar biosynthesis/type III secretory pathway chaperone
MSDTAQQLRALLTAERGTLKTLEVALDAEREALGSANVEALESATQSKRSAIQQQQERQQARGEFIDQALGTNLSLSDALARLGNQDEDRALGQEVIDLAKRCHEINRRNGTLILRQQDRTRSALDVLRGVDLSSDLYSLDGVLSNAASDSRSLGKA